MTGSSFPAHPARQAHKSLSVYVVWAPWAGPSSPAVLACRELALTWERGERARPGPRVSVIPDIVGLLELPFGITFGEVRLEMLRGHALASPFHFLVDQCGLHATTPLPSWIFVEEGRADDDLSGRDGALRVQVHSAALPKFHVKEALERFAQGS